MDRVVHCDEVKSLGSFRSVRMPAVQEHGDVVIPMQENEGALALNNEDRVDELRDL